MSQETDSFCEPSCSSAIDPGAVGEASPWQNSLIAARAGNRQALGQLIEQVRDYLMLVADRELDDAVRAKVGASDVVQQTMLEAGRDLGRFRGDTPGELRSWLIRILRHNLTDVTREYRGTQRRDIGREIRVIDGGLDLVSKQRTASSICRRVEADAQLDRAMTQLPKQYQAAISLRHVSGLEWSEVGSRLGLSAEAARKIWARALAKLREQLAGNYESRIESIRRSTDR